MKVNVPNLPTPGPLAVKNPVLSLYGAIKKEDGSIPKTGFEKLSERGAVLSTIFLFTSIGIGLISSGVSLNHGLTQFQYPVLSGLDTLNVVTLSIKIRGVEIPRNSGFAVSNPVGSLLFKGFMITTFSIPTLLNYLGNIISLGIYASLKNFPKISQLITNCSQIPNVPGGTIAQCVDQSSGGYTCHLGSKSSWIIDLVIRSLGIITFPIFLGLFSTLDLSGKKKLGRLVSLVTFLVAGFYMISMALTQSQGVSNEGLENCEVSQEVLSSKSGYIQEWYEDKTNTLRKIALQ